MSQTFEFYDSRAKEAAKQAENATLDNVKERHLRAAESWRGLADKAKGVAEARARVERDKAAEREKAAAAAE